MALLDSRLRQLERDARRTRLNGARDVIQSFYDAAQADQVLAILIAAGAVTVHADGQTVTTVSGQTLVAGEAMS